MLSVSLAVADLILFWASRCVIPSVLTPSMAEMTSPWARLPPAALLPGVIYGRVNRAGYTRIQNTQLKRDMATQRQGAEWVNLHLWCMSENIKMLNRLFTWLFVNALSHNSTGAQVTVMYHATHLFMLCVATEVQSVQDRIILLSLCWLWKWHRSSRRGKSSLKTSYWVCVIFRLKKEILVNLLHLWAFFFFLIQRRVFMILTDFWLQNSILVVKLLYIKMRFNWTLRPATYSIGSKLTVNSLKS